MRGFLSLLQIYIFLLTNRKPEKFQAAAPYLKRKRDQRMKKKRSWSSIFQNKVNTENMVFQFYILRISKKKGENIGNHVQREIRIFYLIKSFQIFIYYSCSIYAQKYNGGEIGTNFQRDVNKFFSQYVTNVCFRFKKFVLN